MELYYGGKYSTNYFKLHTSIVLWVKGSEQVLGSVTTEQQLSTKLHIVRWFRQFGCRLVFTRVANECNDELAKKALIYNYSIEYQLLLIVLY